MTIIGYVPSSPVFLHNVKFDRGGRYNRDGWLTPFAELRDQLATQAISIDTIDMVDGNDALDVVIFMNIDYYWLNRVLSRKRRPLLIYIASEPEIIVAENSEAGLRWFSGIFDYILTWNDDLVDNQKFFKFNYLLSVSEARKGFEGWSRESSLKPQKLLANISSNRIVTTTRGQRQLYSERLKVIEYFEARGIGDFEFYGSGWDAENHPCFRGIAENKRKVYSNFRFALCFENMTGVNGYISEKIFDCFRFGVIPVYWGADNIASRLPPNCFIDYRSLGRPEALHTFLLGVSDSERETYLKNIKEFLFSDEIETFGSAFLASQLRRILELPTWPASPLKRLTSRAAVFLFRAFKVVNRFFSRRPRKRVK